MNQYISIFIDKDYPIFINKYLSTKTLDRLKYRTQFCGNDYTKFYSPRFLYTRFDHSLVAANMTWYFTHNKKETIEKSIIKTRFDRLSDLDKKLVTFLCNQAQYLSRFIIIWSLLELVTSIYNKDVDSSIIYALGTAMHISFLRLLKYLNTEIADEEEEEIISDSYDKDTIIKNNETAIDFLRSLNDKEKEKYLCLKLR